ncbi:DUF2161 domain-containing phosphodiesterase [Bacillus salitolerans]|uniref:DUF2161 domain-containing phosphodiesterase n=1 Tax=Bacillus salitolerans TaxID=1437434 RepID=A0ABW4LTH1_9BACI
MKEKHKIHEVDLYKPIQRFFIREDFEVYGEVNDCDMVAVKGDQVVIIELKRNLSVELLVQATKRQRITDDVYVAIPKPSYNLRSKRWTDVCLLIRRLELGLIIVSFAGNGRKAEVVIHPSSFNRKKSISQNKRRREHLLNEINGRSADYNIGGSTRTKIMTAYKENCIQIACYLNQFGEMSPKALREKGTGVKTSSIISKNYYGWFVRVRRGVYIISEKGKEDIKEFPEIVNHYLKIVK